MIYVLVETVSSKRQGKPLYFARYTGIGPMTTPDLDEAAKFDSAEHARQSLACAFPLTIFEPRELPLIDFIRGAEGSQEMR